MSERFTLVFTTFCHIYWVFAEDTVACHCSAGTIFEIQKFQAFQSVLKTVSLALFSGTSLYLCYVNSKNDNFLFYSRGKFSARIFLDWDGQASLNAKPMAAFSSLIYTI